MSEKLLSSARADAEAIAAIVNAYRTGMKRLLILGIDMEGNFAFTTYGATKDDCDAMREWADYRAPRIGQEMAEE